MPTPAKFLKAIQQLFAAAPLLENPDTRREGLRETVRAALRQPDNLSLSLAASSALIEIADASPTDWLLRAEALIAGRDSESANAILENLSDLPSKASVAARSYMLAGRFREARNAARLAAAHAENEVDARSAEWIDRYAGAVLGEVRDGPLGKRWRHADTAPDSATIIAIFDYKSPDLARNSVNLGDWMQTLAALRHLARFEGLRWTYDDNDLADILEQLRATWAPHERSVANGDVHLAVVDRDFPLPLAHRFPNRRVWMLANGWYAHKVFSATQAWPAPATIVPVLTSIHIARPDDLTPDRLAWLAKHSPIGARDLATLAILRSVGIPAFHSGCLTMTLSMGVGSPRAMTLEVEPVEPSDDVEQIVHLRRHLPGVDMALALEETLGTLLRYSSTRRVLTSRLHAALPSRAVGTPVVFEPPRPSDPRFAGLVDLDDAAFQSKADTASTMMRDTLDAILSGSSHEDVRAAIGEHVGLAPGRRPAEPGVVPASTGPLPESVTVAVSFDERYAAPARTMLASLRRNTKAAIHLVIMTRGLSEGFVRDIVDVAEPASLRIIDMTGRLAGVTINLADRTSISTMDRLFLPTLLPDVDKVVYLDVDLMVFDDIAELARFDPGLCGIAARFLGGEHNIAGAVEKHARDIDASTAAELRDWVGTHGNFAQRRFDTGVLVLSLDRMRSAVAGERAIDLVERFALQGRDALNLASGGNATALPNRWNFLSGIDLIEHPGIIHWVGARKPWTAGVVPYQQAWRTLEKGLRKQIDRDHWMRASSYPEEWAKRAALIAPWLPKAGRVADIGCGAPMALRRYLDPAVEYVPTDLRAWTADVTAIDLDRGEFPPGRFDAVAMLGVLEYLEKPGAALARARRAAGSLVVSYCHPRSGVDPSSRTDRGWINAFTEDRFGNLLLRFGWHVTEQELFSKMPNMQQIVYRCVAGDSVTPS